MTPRASGRVKHDESRLYMADNFSRVFPDSHTHAEYAILYGGSKTGQRYSHAHAMHRWL